MAIKNRPLFIILLFILLFVVLLFSIGTGVVFISPMKILSALFHGDTSDKYYRIIMYARLPRIAGAVFAGAALSVSGVIIQVVLNNPLASPTIIGVNSGAGFFVVASLLLLPASPNLIPIMAFTGAVLTSLLIYFISLRAGSARMVIILAGIAIGSILSAGINMMTTLFPEILPDTNSFMIGGLSGVSQRSLQPAVWYILAGITAALFLSKEMNVYALGDETAASLGMRTGLIRFLLIAVSSMLAGAAVSFCGLLGFVGLVVPHLARAFVGSNNRILIPSSALLGSIFILLCDTLSRVLFSPYEVPVGIIMSFIGGPFFLYLIVRRKKNGFA